MKNLIFFLVIASILLMTCYGCKNSNDQSIIGVWKYSRSFENGIEYELDSCEKQDQLEFLVDGTFTEKYYYLDESNKCALDGKNTGSWRKKEKDTFLIDYDGEVFKIVLQKKTFYLKYEDEVIKKEIYTRQ